jgi:hypothetical protein
MVQIHAALPAIQIKRRIGEILGIKGLYYAMPVACVTRNSNGAAVNAIMYRGKRTKMHANAHSVMALGFSKAKMFY